MIHTAYLLPITALIAWSLIMWLWMYATRLPAIMKSGQPMDPLKPKSELLKFCPRKLLGRRTTTTTSWNNPRSFMPPALCSRCYL
jgi:hypothetical protein